MSSNLIPQKMSQDELVAVLSDMLERVTQGDSYEGNIEYLMPEIDDEDWVQFHVRGVYRIGNLEGQGGMRMIGTVPEPKEDGS